MSQTYNDRRRVARRDDAAEIAYDASYAAYEAHNYARRNTIGWVLTLIAIVCAIGAFALIIRNELARPAPITIAPAQPTLPSNNPIVRATLAAAPATSAETLSVATPQANQPAAAPPAVVAPQFSPVDLGDVPVPTPQTTLSAEQYANSQATEEETFLRNANAGLTPAQRAVAEYNACVAAGGCGVVK